MRACVIYHNPDCSKSRATLALLKDRGIAVEIIRYLQTPLNEAELTALLQLLDLRPSDLARRSEAIWQTLELDTADEAGVLQAMAAHPQLMQRPVVVHGQRAAIGRPPEQVLTLFEESNS